MKKTSPMFVKFVFLALLCFSLPAITSESTTPELTQDMQRSQTVEGSDTCFLSTEAAEDMRYVLVDETDGVTPIDTPKDTRSEAMAMFRKRLAGLTDNPDYWNICKYRDVASVPNLNELLNEKRSFGNADTKIYETVQASISGMMTARFA